MSILGTIASDLGSVVSDPGKLVSDVVDALLPEKFKSVGDLAGGLVDAALGKESQALGHFQDGLRDLPQLTADSPPASDPIEAADTGTADAATDGTADATTARPTDLGSLLALPSDQFMRAISSGAVPDDVAQDPAALLQIQARVNDIAQMNQMMTSMMSALHQMQMSVAQNIRA